MRRRKPFDAEAAYDALANSPSEATPIIKEFVERMQVIQNEIQVLNEQKGELMEEYKDKIDTKTLKLAMRIVEIEKKVLHKDTFELFLEILKDNR
jgi:uncharacterized protein (UPF0335 family)